MDLRWSSMGVLWHRLAVSTGGKIEYGENLVGGSDRPMATSLVHELGHYLFLVFDEHYLEADFPWQLWTKCALNWESNHTSIMCNKMTELRTRQIKELSGLPVYTAECLE